MEPLDFGDLPQRALLLVDSAPIIYVLEDHPKLAPRFRLLFEEHAAGRLRFTVTTITIAEVLAGPIGAATTPLLGAIALFSNPGDRLRSTLTLLKAPRDYERPWD
jgi:hypothetical protein